MKKTKVWLIDALDNGKVNFHLGQKVVLFRRKPSGYPKHIEDNIHYTIKSIIFEDLVVVDESQKYRELKAHFSYFIPVDYSRNEIIDEILKDL